MIHRAEHKENYTRLTNSVIRNEELTDSAFRLLIFMLSCSDDWSFSLKGLAHQLSWPERKVARLVNELKKKGHIVQRINFDEKGKFLPSTWDVYEDAADGLRVSRIASATQSVNHAKREPRKASPTHSVNRAAIRINNIKERTNSKKEQEGKKDHPHKFELGNFENVLLTNEEQKDLCERFGYEAACEYIDRLSRYLHDHPEKNYSSHKATIEKWITEDERRVAT